MALLVNEARYFRESGGGHQPRSLRAVPVCFVYGIKQVGQISAADAVATISRSVVYAGTTSGL